MLRGVENVEQKGGVNLQRKTQVEKITEEGVYKDALSHAWSTKTGRVNNPSRSKFLSKKVI